MRFKSGRVESVKISVRNIKLRVQINRSFPKWPRRKLRQNECETNYAKCQSGQMGRKSRTERGNFVAEHRLNIPRHGFPLFSRSQDFQRQIVMGLSGRQPTKQQRNRSKFLKVFVTTAAELKMLCHRLALNQFQ